MTPTQHDPATNHPATSECAPPQPTLSQEEEQWLQQQLDDQLAEAGLLDMVGAFSFDSTDSDTRLTDAEQEAFDAWVAQNDHHADLHSSTEPSSHSEDRRDRSMRTSATGVGAEPASL